MACRVGPRFVIEAMAGPCVVTRPSWPAEAEEGVLRGLINPANRALVGPALPYFPKGGPLPPPPPPSLLRSDSGWGGMTAGDGMVYPSQVSYLFGSLRLSRCCWPSPRSPRRRFQSVDGIVHQHGGEALRRAIAAAAAPIRADDAHPGLPPLRCETGCTVMTSGIKSLPHDVIAHTPPPFWDPGAAPNSEARRRWELALSQCYISAITAMVGIPRIAGGRGSLLVATPVIGAGVCGAPAKESLEIAVAAAQQAAIAAAADGRTSDVRLRFVVPEPEIYALLTAILGRIVDVAYPGCSGCE